MGPGPEFRVAMCACVCVCTAGCIGILVLRAGGIVDLVKAELWVKRRRSSGIGAEDLGCVCMCWARGNGLLLGIADLLLRRGSRKAEFRISLCSGTVGVHRGWDLRSL
jgi:hypothetical protein